MSPRALATAKRRDWARGGLDSLATHPHGRYYTQDEDQNKGKKKPGKICREGPLDEGIAWKTEDNYHVP